MAADVNPKSNRLFIVIGVVLAIVAFFLVIFVTRTGSGTSGGQSVDVVVAKVNLAQGVPITADMVDKAAYPAPGPADVVLDPAAAVGQVPSVPVSAHSPITQSVLVNAHVTPIGANSLPITKGDVAMSIPTSYGTAYTTADLQNVANYVQPEDHIDILVADAVGTIRFSFQDVRVLRVGTSTGTTTTTSANGQATTAAAASTGTPTVLLIELPRNQAELMTYLITRPVKAADDAGKPIGPEGILVKYVLRPREDYNKDKTPPNYLGNTGSPVPGVPDPGAGAAALNALFGPH